MTLNYHAIFTFAILLPACDAGGLLIAVPNDAGEDAAPTACVEFDASTPCPAGFVDNCLPGSPIIGACCYTNAEGQSAPIGICADGGVS